MRHDNARTFRSLDVIVRDEDLISDDVLVGVEVESRIHVIEHAGDVVIIISRSRSDEAVTRDDDVDHLEDSQEDGTTVVEISVDNRDALRSFDVRAVPGAIVNR